MPHTYNQSTGEWRHNGGLLGVGYSGFEQGLNNPLEEGDVGIGPIPCGTWKIHLPVECAQTLDGKTPCPDCKGTVRHQHGPYILRLSPDAQTAVRVSNLHRDPWSFLCHGGKIGENNPKTGTASRGCIIQVYVVRQAIVQLATTGDDQLTVISGFPVKPVTT